MAESATIGRYELVAPLCAGGMARIDLARLRGPYGFTRHVAIKRPLPHQAADPAALEQFRIEARLLASIHHPNVIAFLEAGRDAEGVDFLAIEYLHGLSVRELAPPRGARLARRPSLAAALTIASQAAAGLDHAHAGAADDGTTLGLVHRDVSPSNVLVGYDGSVKLIDFGVAKLTEGATLSGSLRGKVTYMAPEQCKGEPIDRRADVYGLGVMLYELVTGHRPFYAADEVASLHKVIVGGTADPRAIDPAIDPELAAIIARAMAYAVDDRYPCAATFGAELDAFAARHALALTGATLVAELASLGAPKLEPWRIERASHGASHGATTGATNGAIATELARRESLPAGVTGASPRRRRRWPAAVLAGVAAAAMGYAGHGLLQRDTPPTARATAASGEGSREEEPATVEPVAPTAPVAAGASPTEQVVEPIAVEAAQPVSTPPPPPRPSTRRRDDRRRARERSAAAEPVAVEPATPAAVAPTATSPPAPPVAAETAAPAPRRPPVWDPKAFYPAAPKPRPAAGSGGER